MGTSDWTEGASRNLQVLAEHGVDAKDVIYLAYKLYTQNALNDTKENSELIWSFLPAEDPNCYQMGNHQCSYNGGITYERDHKRESFISNSEKLGLALAEAIFDLGCEYTGIFDKIGDEKVIEIDRVEQGSTWLTIYA